jgi:hypothetical protein
MDRINTILQCRQDFSGFTGPGIPENKNPVNRA